MLLRTVQFALTHQLDNPQCVMHGSSCLGLFWALNDKNIIAEAHIASAIYSTVMEVQWRISDVQMTS